MKQIKTLFILTLCFTAYIIIPTEHHTSSLRSTHNALPMIADLETVKTVSWCRLILLPTLLTIVSYMHKTAIINSVYNNPLSFIAVSYLLGNYLIDTIAKYNQVNKTLHFLLLSHAMNRYMLCAFAVKNNILQRYKNHSQSFNEQQFFQKITLHTGYSIEELEFFITELIHQSSSFMNDIFLDNHQDLTNDHMYYILKEKITIEQVLDASKHDPTLYHALIKYTQNPEEECDAILETIGILIKQQINSFIKKTFTFFQEYDNYKVI